MITSCRVGKHNIWSIVQLRVHDEQQGFVATNTEGILRVYTTMIEGGVALPSGIYNGKSLIGSIIFGYGRQKENDPPITQNNYSIQRFMIDRAWQGKEPGKQALQTSTDFVKTIPCGKAEFVWLSYRAENIAVRALYYTTDFHKNDRPCDGKTVTVLQLKETQQYENTEILGILSERGASSPLPPHINQEALHFEPTQTFADSQLKPVFDNIERAIASSLYAYEIQQGWLPQANDLSVLTDWAGTPFCVIKTTVVTILPFYKVTFAPCTREGEDDTLES